MKTEQGIEKEDHGHRPGRWSA